MFEIENGFDACDVQIHKILTDRLFGKVQPASISTAKDSQLESPLLFSVFRKRNIAKFDQSASSSVKTFLPGRCVNTASVYLLANLIGQYRAYKKVKQISIVVFKAE